MRYLIGIDDTDNLETRGTGYCARQLIQCLARVSTPLAITRHQLLVVPEIPFTSHNSSACLVIEANPAQEEEIWQVSREFLIKESAPGSDVGLCLANWECVTPHVHAFGARAKQIVLTRLEAEQTARQDCICIEGLTGTGGGIIGALAAVGLHHAGNDGRFLWLPSLRDLKGRYTVHELCTLGSIAVVQTINGEHLPPQILVDVGEWVRPILRNGQAILLVEEKNNEWSLVTKDQIKRISD